MSICNSDSSSSRRTPVSLLERLKDRKELDFQRFVEIYEPFLRAIALRQMQAWDADDLVQEALLTVAKEISTFDRERTGSFRKWLRTILSNRVKACIKAKTRWPSQPISDFFDALQDPRSGPSQQWDADHDSHVLQKLLQIIRPEFEESTWHAFERVAIRGERAAEVAADLKMSVGSVWTAKSRVLNRLRAEAVALVDDF